MDTKRTDVSSSFAANPEDTHITVFIILNQTALIDCSDSELFFDSRDKGRALEARTFQRVDSFLKLLDLVETLMKLDDSDVLFTGRLLSLHESSGVVDAHYQTSSDFGVKSAGVASLFNFENFLNPGDDFVGGWV